MPSLSGLYPGPPPDFPKLAPESNTEFGYFFRCQDCRELFAVGTGLLNGDLVECDTKGCLAQYYALLAPD
jgi:hypothetical protein